MKISDVRTPVLILGCRIGAVTIARSLGSLGVHVYGVESDPKAPALRSRYFKETFVCPFDQNQPEKYLATILNIGRRLGCGGPTILIPTSDELSEWMADHRQALKPSFLFQNNPPELVRGLASKKFMYDLAVRNRIPTASTLFPEKMDDVLSALDSIIFPVMLKGIYGNRLEARTGYKMVIARNREELIAYYKLLDDPGDPNLMIQELIPGDDQQVFIFNGYFNRHSECLTGFTGYKVRQCPIHVGCASLGECRSVPEVTRITTDFMKQIGYQGILDIGYRLDPRDGRYKVLDINPRVGQAFRIFVGHNGMDVVRALYLDLTGQPVPPTLPREGRRWIIEDYDFIFSVPAYFAEGSISIRDWLRSFNRVEEAAWFDLDDIAPFLALLQNYIQRLMKWGLSRI